jgi:hypothetical protein
MKCSATKGKVYTALDQYKLCTKLSASSPSLTSITSTPTTLIDDVTDMKTVGSITGIETVGSVTGMESQESVTGFTNKTNQSGFSSNINSSSSTVSTVQKIMIAATRQNYQKFTPREQFEYANGSTKGGGEDSTSDETTKPPRTYDIEESHESGEEANTILFVLLFLCLFVALAILCVVTCLIVLYLTGQRFVDLQDYLRNFLRISNGSEQTSSKSEAPLLPTVQKKM